MKENEIRVGNIVQKNGVEYVADFLTIKMAHNYKPVPLTPEVLEQCGFKKQTAWYRLGKHAINPTAAYLYEFKNIPVKEIEHLHQLQNLYYALTGNELEVKQTV